jgi:peptide/nickel transport system permease protein
MHDFSVAGEHLMTHGPVRSVPRGPRANLLAAWRILRASLFRTGLLPIGLLLVGLFAACALLSPWIAALEPFAAGQLEGPPGSSAPSARPDPARIDLSHRLLAPAAGHWFGTDELGRDIFTRTVFGARISMTVALSVVGISLLAGVIIGGLAGFYGGWLDTFLNIYITNAFLALPGILLAIAFVAFLGAGLMNLILALALSGWVGYARLTRAQVMSIKGREFVEAARALGASDLRVFCRHILPNILQPLIVQAAIGMAAAVLSEATLSFLGLGVPPPAPSWGAMLNDGRSHLFDSPHLVFFPATAVMLCVLSFNFIGDALRDYLDPRTRIAAGI